MLQNAAITVNICSISYDPSTIQNMGLITDTVHANNQDADQPAYPHCLISAFVIYPLVSQIAELVICKIPAF